MEFAFPAAAEAFRAELRAFIRQELPDWWTGLFANDERVFPFCRQFCQKLADRGWLTMAWPREYGGQDADIWQQMVVREEMIAVGEPRGSQYMNLNYIGPAIMMFGTPAQKERFLKPMGRGEAFWCQGFSEPGAGSDVAAAQTRAVDTGEHFVVNGQKIWTSYAIAAEHCLLVARTDPDAPKHKGLSMFLVDMDTPGITVRPIDSMGGPVEFNEVFFDNVVVPHDRLLGPLNEGWNVILTSLAFERGAFATHVWMERALAGLIRYLKSERDDSGRSMIDNPAVRADIVRMKTRVRASRLLCYRLISRQDAGAVDAVDPAVAKIYATEAAVHVGETSLKLLGAKGQILAGDPLAPLRGNVYGGWVHSIPMVIAAGSNEIQRNIIAGRGLGLPR